LPIRTRMIAVGSLLEQVTSKLLNICFSFSLK
jgi:hypothetical protein